MGALSGSGDNGPQQRSLSLPPARLRAGGKILSAVADGRKTISRWPRLAPEGAPARGVR